jgi:uncharacterized membrane protein
MDDILWDKQIWQYTLINIKIMMFIVPQFPADCCRVMQFFTSNIWSCGLFVGAGYRLIFCCLSCGQSVSVGYLTYLLLFVLRAICRCGQSVGVGYLTYLLLFVLRASWLIFCCLSCGQSVGVGYLTYLLLFVLRAICWCGLSVGVGYLTYLLLFILWASWLIFCCLSCGQSVGVGYLSVWAI